MITLESPPRNETGSVISVEPIVIKDSRPFLHLRLLEERDLEATTSVHLAAFSDSAIPRLGKDAALKYCGFFLFDVPDSLALGVFTDGQLVGYCIGSPHDQPERLFLRRNLCFIAQCLMKKPALLAMPFFRDRIRTGIRSLFSRRPKECKAPSSARIFNLHYIAVDPRYQNRGIGTQLLKACEDWVRASKFDQIKLRVFPANRRAVRFYERAGWFRSAPDCQWRGSMLKSVSIAGTKCTQFTPAEQALIVPSICGPAGG